MTLQNPVADVSQNILTPPTKVMMVDLAGNGYTLNAAGALPVQSQAAASASATLQSAAAATGAGTVFSVLGMSSAQFTVTGTFVGTITWQGSEDGTNYSSLFAVQMGTNTIATTATATGTFEASVAGLQSIRANITAYTSGAITVTAHAVPGTFSPRVTNVNVVTGSALMGHVDGSVASAGTNANNPVKVGGPFNTTQPTVTNGQIVDGQYTARGASIVAPGVDNFGVQLQTSAGVALVADQTNSILRTSLYGKNAAAADTALQLDGTSGALRMVAQASANMLTSSNTAAVNTALATTTLPAVSAKTNYLTGFSVTTQGGSGAAAGVVTVTGTISGTLSYQVGAAANNSVTLNVNFPHPIPASAANTAITVNVPTLGANTGAVASAAYGYVQ